MPPEDRVLIHHTTEDREQLRRMNAEVERLYKDGLDNEARTLEIRANALARRIFRSVAR